MSFSNLFKYSYWFVSPLSPSVKALWIMGIFFTLFIIFGVFALYRRAHAIDGVSRGVWRRFAGWAFTAGIFGYFFWFARYEQVLIFRDRYWLLIWLVITLVWLGFVVRHAKKRAPALNTKAREEAYRERYLPKPKK